MPPELAALRASARAAAERRAALEAQISRACAALEGMPCGVSGALVDAEGFPRGDCDVHQARALRHRLACLHTDHKQAERALERALHALHAAAPAAPSGSAPSASAPAAAPSTAAANAPAHPAGANGGGVAAAAAGVGGVQLDPFGAPLAAVGEVQDGGPAADAGLRRGDSILTFGAVGGGGDLAALAAEARMGVGRALGVRVLRREAFGEASLMLTVTPRESPAWRGLLGVQILPPPPS